jgi:2-hydroxychromene-2-carboxylate isomerase
MTGRRSVQFFFGVGSRYSYLAATQIPKLAAETGVLICSWGIQRL